MKTIAVSKAAGLRIDSPEDVTILISGEPPDFKPPDVLHKAEAFHQTQAEILVEALVESLPNGTLSRVTSLLMKREADRCCYQGTADDPGGGEADRKWPRLAPLYTGSGRLIPRYSKATAADILIEQRRVVDQKEREVRMIELFLENARDSVRKYEAYLMEGDES